MFGGDFFWPDSVHNHFSVLQVSPLMIVQEVSAAASHTDGGEESHSESDFNIAMRNIIPHCPFFPVTNML